MIISALPQHGQAVIIMEKNDMKKPGSAWGTGRPSTGRTHPVTVRLSDLAIEALSKVKNKSLYVDYLIRFDYLQSAQHHGK